MNLHQENAGDGHVKPVGRQPAKRQQHDGNLKHLDANGDGTFAETVRKITAGHGEKNERQREHSAHHPDKLVAFVIGEPHARDQRNNKPFEGIVAERALELSHKQPPEAALPLVGR